MSWHTFLIDEIRSTMLLVTTKFLKCKTGMFNTNYITKNIRKCDLIYLLKVVIIAECFENLFQTFFPIFCAKTMVGNWHDFMSSLQNLTIFDTRTNNVYCIYLSIVNKNCKEMSAEIFVTSHHVVQKIILKPRQNWAKKD